MCAYRRKKLNPPKKSPIYVSIDAIVSIENAFSLLECVLSLL
jgi:hypothetical protein